MHMYAAFLEAIKVMGNISILAVKKADNLNTKQKWLANTLREYSLASQSERMPQSCFYVNVACLFYGEYM